MEKEERKRKKGGKGGQEKEERREERKGRGRRKGKRREEEKEGREEKREHECDFNKVELAGQNKGWEERKGR